MTRCAGMSDPHRRAFSEGGGIDGARAIRTAEVQSRPIPVPRKHRSDKREASSFEDSFTAINLSDDQPVFASSDVQSLLSRVEQLKNEEMCLIEHITSLRKEKMEIEQNSQFKELKKREIELAEHEQDLNLRKSRIDSEYSDREFKLAQKQRELQHLEDQLHMKSKDLKQKEFDIANADSPADVSSTQLAELANRQFELERREQELQYKQDYLHEWSLKLQEKENEYKRRWDDLLCRESSFYSQAQASPLHYNYSSDYDRQRQSPRTSDQVRAENPHAPAYGQSFGGQQVTGSRNDEYKDHRIDQLPDDSSQHQSTTERLQPLNVFPERKQDNQIAKDLELAQKLMVFIIVAFGIYIDHQDIGDRKSVV